MLRDIPTERIGSLKKRLSDLRAQIDQSNSEFPNKNPSLRLSKELEE